MKLILWYLCTLSLLFPQDIIVIRRAPVASGGTSPVYSSYCNGSATSQYGECNWTGTPSAGQAVVGVVWIPAAATVSAVCDGTGTDGCTGSSTYTIQTKYSNSTNFASVVYYTCNFAGSSGIKITFDSSRSYYASGIAITGNSTTGCSDGYNNAQSTSAGTAYQSGTVSTSNANSLLVGLMTNGCGGGSYTAGQDGQGHTYTIRASQSVVTMVESLSAAATGTYYAAATGPSCVWNAEILAIK